MEEEELPFYVNMQKNLPFTLLILYPGFTGLGLLSYPGTFSILTVVAVNIMSVFTINVFIRKQYYYDLSQVSNLNVAGIITLSGEHLRLMAKL